MSSIQPWIAWLLAGCCSVGAVAAQESTGGASGASGASEGTSGAGASSAFGSPAPSPPSGTGTTPSTPGTPDTPSAAGTGTGTGAGAGAASSFGTGASPQAQEAPAAFSVSPGYGMAPQVFVAGEGRLARPRFQTKLSTSLGFDDNIFQTPTDGEDIPEQRIPVVVEPAVPDQIVFVLAPQSSVIDIRANRDPLQPRRLIPVFVPGKDAVIDEIVIPGQKAAERQASAISRAALSFNAQVASRRSLFTFDFNANADYYWNRAKDPTDYNGNVSLIYLRRLTPRMQFTTSVNASYQTQPDLTQINTPTRTGAGEFLNFTSKSDLSYRWTPRFSTVSSLSYNQLTFIEEAAQTGDYGQTTFGTELRYLWSPRLTAVAEGRYSQFRYENNATLDSHTYFALFGLDVTVTRRASGTIRIGAAMRQFDESGKKSTAPYLETTLLYQLGKASVLSWNGRFGFEEPADANSEVLSLRSGVTVNHFFSPRLRGAISFNGIQRVTTNDVTDDSLTQLTFDSTVSLEYSLTRRWTFTGNYSFTAVIDDPGQSDYFRNRLFVGAEYEF